MKSIPEQLAECVREAMGRMGVEGDPLVRPSQDETFGHYQSNCAMSLAKRLGRRPREVAEALVAALDLGERCPPPDIAGPGFINFRLQPTFLARCLERIPPCGDPAGDRVGIDPVADPQRVVIDFSSPNLAKEMHVGHLRSTVIGDCIARVLEFQGHTVMRENHVGDWGTQFGMLVAYLRATDAAVVDSPDRLVIADLESFYVKAKARFDSNKAFKRQSRETVVALQRGDEATRRIWRAFCDESLRHCHAIYDRLGVQLTDRGESFYTDRMNDVIARLESMDAPRADGFVSVSDGALCLFMDGFKTRDGDPLPMIVRKSDGGFNYATSDLATILHRVEELRADRIIYVVGSPQKQHFDMLFAAARRAGWVDQSVSLTHLAFGSMLAKNGKPFKTREGGTAKLKTLLDEAVTRAAAVIRSVQRDAAAADRRLSGEEAETVAERVGLGAVKYFDLSHSLASDYRFDLDSMLAMEGNTAPYMMYAYARIRSIGDKAGVNLAALSTDTPMVLDHPAELNLGLKILQFADALETVGRELKPNVMTDYLFGLAKAFSRFYDRQQGVRVIDASPEPVRWSRLRLCDLTARVLRLGLHLLGIETVERM